ncbi:MAG: hypothetical protein WC413_01550 [Candidatus Nanoarchaeia archaeon]
MRYYNIYWSEIYTKAPIDLYNVCSIARKVERKIKFKISKEDFKLNQSLEWEIIGIGADIDILLGIIISLIPELIEIQKDNETKDELETKRVIEKTIEFYIGLIKRRVNELNEVNSKQMGGLASMYHLRTYLNEMSNILYNLIYYPLCNASKKCNMDKKKFLYYFWSELKIKLLAFGSPYSFVSKKDSLKIFDDISFDNLYEPKLQKTISENSSLIKKDLDELNSMDIKDLFK